MLTASELNAKLPYAFGNELDFLHQLGRALPIYADMVMIGAGPGVMGLALLEAVSRAAVLRVVDHGDMSSMEAHMRAAGHGDRALYYQSESQTLDLPHWFHLVIVDGDHSYAGVLGDLNMWAPKTDLLFIHDYIDTEHDGTNGVRSAVETFIDPSTWTVIGEPGVSIVYTRIGSAWTAWQYHQSTVSGSDRSDIATV